MGWKIEFKIKKKGVHVIDRNFLREEIRSLSFFFIIIDRFMKRYSIDQMDGCNWTILFSPFFFFFEKLTSLSPNTVDVFYLAIPERQIVLSTA